MISTTTGKQMRSTRSTSYFAVIFKSFDFFGVDISFCSSGRDMMSYFALSEPEFH